jgi:hypothetical protein
MIKNKLVQYCFCIKKVFLVLIIASLSCVFILLSAFTLTGCDLISGQSATKQGVSAQASNNSGFDNNQESTINNYGFMDIKNPIKRDSKLIK